MGFLGCCGLHCACGCSHPYLAVPRVSKETDATATRKRLQRNFALKEKTFLLARLFVVASRGFDGVTLGNLGDGYVPPGLVAGNSLVVGSLDHDYRRAALFAGGGERSFQIVCRSCARDPGAEAGGVGRKIHGKRLAIVFATVFIAATIA